MKTTIRLFSAICFITSLISCSGNRTKNQASDVGNNKLINPNQLIEFNIENPGTPESIKLSELGVDDIEYIPFETTDSCLVSHISKFITDGESFIFYQSEGIMRFDKDGSFITNIGKTGRGPQEYQNAHDFQIDPVSGNIYVLSGWEDKFYVFSPMGKFIKYLPAPEKATKFVFNEGEILCYSGNIDGNVEHSFDVIDYEGNIRKSFPNKYKYERGKLGLGFSNECFTFDLNHEVLIKEIFCDTVLLKNNRFIHVMSLTGEKADCFLKPER